MNTLFSVFVFLVLVQAAFGLYGPKSNVVALSKKNFADMVIGSEHVWVVEFYAPWCGHCKQLAPEYDKAATNLKGIVKVGAVDCDVEKELCGSFEVKGFPTVKLFPSKTVPVPKKEGAFHKVPEDYQGARTAASIAKFALSKLPSFVTAVTSSSHDKFIEDTLPKAILFTNKDKTSDLYKALSIDFHHRFALGEAKHTDKKLVEKYGVTTFPTLLILAKSEGGENIKFDGQLSHDALVKFLEPHAAPAPKQEKKAGGSTKTKEPEPEAEPETGEIFLVKDQAHFDEKCVNKGGLCAVAFLDYNNFEQEEIDRYTAILKALGEKYKGKLRVFYLDGPSQPALTKALDLSANYPNAVVLSTKKLRYTPFMGAFSEDSLSDFFDAVLMGRKSSFSYPALAITPFTAPPPKPPRTEEPEEKEEL